MAQEEERSYYRAMTAEEINDENEKFQRKLTEKVCVVYFLVAVSLIICNYFENDKHFSCIKNCQQK